MNSSVVLQLIAVPVSIVVAAGNVCALVWGVWTYKRNADAQLQLLALATLQHYLDLAVAHPDLASRDESLTVDVRYTWSAAQALTTAQTTWRRHIEPEALAKIPEQAANRWEFLHASAHAIF
jgi:lipase chaperone LimK